MKDCTSKVVPLGDSQADLVLPCQELLGKYHVNRLACFLKQGLMSITAKTSCCELIHDPTDVVSMWYRYGTSPRARTIDPGMANS